jgi:hypothetical protein
MIHALNLSARLKTAIVVTYFVLTCCQMQDACAVASDEKSGEACVWCECGAIPSECVSASMAKRLPSAVFKCAAPRDAPAALAAAVPDLQLQERRQRLHIHELMLHVSCTIFLPHTVQPQ